FAGSGAAAGDAEAVRDRHVGYQRALSSAGIHVASAQDLSDTYQGVRAHLASGAPVDGLVVGTYSRAAAALRAVTDAGLRVPEDVAVMSFDGDLRNSYAQIVLSTVQ